MKKLIAFGLVALAALTACNTSNTDLLEDDSSDTIAFYAPKQSATARLGVQNLTLQADGDVPAMRVKLGVKSRKNIAGQIEKIATATIKWDDTSTTLTGLVTLETRVLGSATILGTNSPSISSNKTTDAVTGYAGNIATSTAQVVGTNSLCLDVTWTLGARATGAASDDYSFVQTKKVTYCQKQPPPAVADVALVSAGNVSAASTIAKPVKFSVLNNGPKTATNVSVAVTIPSGLEYVAPAPSNTLPFWTCSTNTPSNTLLTCNTPTMSKGAKDLSVSFKGTTLATYALAAVVSSGVIDPISANNNASSNLTVTTTPVNVTAADLAVQITQPVTPLPKVGTSFTYTIAIANIGPDASTAARTLTIYRSSSLNFGSATAAGVTCTNTGDVTNCSLPSIANGATISVPLVVTPSAAGTVGITAQLAANNEDDTASNNTSAVSSDVQP